MTLLIRELRDTTAQWVKGGGPLSHVVVSTRMRLARNIKGVSFPFKASQKELRNVLKKGEDLLKDNEYFHNFKILKINELTSIDIKFLVEKRLISILLAKANYPYRAIIFEPEEVISLMVNEEDHFRIQCLLPGFQLENVWKLTNECDDQIMNEIKFAFHKDEGFLTCCPTNVGTGLRASIMLHLPGLFATNRLNNLLVSVSKMGFAVRGFYGEGTNYLGNLFQISNQITLGLSEENIIDNLKDIIVRLIKEEENARDRLMIKSRNKIEDQVMRAYGVLANARIISTVEAINLLSKIRLGIETGIFAKIGYDTINRLMLVIQSAYIQLLFGKEMSKTERNMARAKLIQEFLG